MAGPPCSRGAYLLKKLLVMYYNARPRPLLYSGMTVKLYSGNTYPKYKPLLSSWQLSGMDWTPGLTQLLPKRIPYLMTLLRR